MDYFVTTTYSMQACSMTSCACHEKLGVKGVCHRATSLLLKIEATYFLHFLEIPELNIVVGTSCCQRITHRIERHSCAFFIVRDHFYLRSIWKVQSIFNVRVVIQMNVLSIESCYCEINAGTSCAKSTIRLQC